jgi:hypothetical protein
MSTPPNTMQKLLKPLVGIAKKIAFKHTSIGAPTYAYNIEPIQLATLINELERLRTFSGCIVEIGVARGMTTRFIAQHLVDQKRLHETVYAMDTFASFMELDLDYEVSHRGKSLSDLKGFEYNDFKAWSRNFKDHPFVMPIQTDCSVFDYRKLGPIKLAFLDVDLYLPIKTTLPILFDCLIPEGVILVDDVMPNMTYDGAYQAYMEFCGERAIQPVVIGNKCGIIRKGECLPPPVNTHTKTVFKSGNNTNQPRESINNES